MSGEVNGKSMLREENYLKEVRKMCNVNPVEVEKTPTPEGISTEQEQQINLTSLLNEYEQLEARLQELTERKQWIRKMIHGELATQNIQETSVITASGTQIWERKQKGISLLRNLNSCQLDPQRKIKTN
jgi:transcription initiation factor TFIID subunit TAF12